MAQAVTLSSKYQIVIPSDVRKAAHLVPGDKLTFVVRGNTIHLVRVRPIEDLRSALAGANTTGFRDREDEP